MSDTTWQKVEERRKMKEKVNNAKTRAQKNDTHTKHQKLDKEIKTLRMNCKREYVDQLATKTERAANMGDIKTLYNISKTLTRRKTCKSKQRW